MDDFDGDSRGTWNRYIGIRMANTQNGQHRFQRPLERSALWKSSATYTDHICWQCDRDIWKCYISSQNPIWKCSLVMNFAIYDWSIELQVLSYITITILKYLDYNYLKYQDRHFLSPSHLICRLFNCHTQLGKIVVIVSCSLLTLAVINLFSHLIKFLVLLLFFILFMHCWGAYTYERKQFLFPVPMLEVESGFRCSSFRIHIKCISTGKHSKWLTLELKENKNSHIWANEVQQLSVLTAIYPFSSYFVT